MKQLRFGQNIFANKRANVWSPLPHPDHIRVTLTDYFPAPMESFQQKNLNAELIVALKCSTMKNSAVSVDGLQG